MPPLLDTAITSSALQTTGTSVSFFSYNPFHCLFKSLTWSNFIVIPLYILVNVLVNICIKELCKAIYGNCILSECDMWVTKLVDENWPIVLK